MVVQESPTSLLRPEVLRRVGLLVATAAGAGTGTVALLVVTIGRDDPPVAIAVMVLGLLFGLVLAALVVLIRGLALLLEEPDADGVQQRLERRLLRIETRVGLGRRREVRDDGTDATAQDSDA